MSARALGRLGLVAVAEEAERTDALGRLDQAAAVAGVGRRRFGRLRIGGRAVGLLLVAAAAEAEGADALGGVLQLPARAGVGGRLGQLRLLLGLARGVILSGDRRVLVATLAEAEGAKALGGVEQAG